MILRIVFYVDSHGSTFYRHALATLNDNGLSQSSSSDPMSSSFALIPMYVASDPMYLDIHWSVHINCFFRSGQMCHVGIFSCN